MEATQEKSLQHKAAETLLVTETRTPFTDLDREAKLALECAHEKKAFDTVALDLREIASFTEFFLICSGANQRQVQAISDEIEEQLKKQLDARPVRIEGYRTAEWVLMDYGDFIIHIFEKNAREFYDLERLWRDAKRVELPEEFNISGSSSTGSGS
jgi:ribosome-associated protein